ncbi:MAG: glutamate racemase [Christensenellaceae bacterium]
MSVNNLPIGFFDSGVGGVSVLKETVKALPYEDYLYYGDSANTPYGTKSEEQIKELSMRCGDFLYQKGVKMIVIACNTATSITVAAMRKKYNIPIVSIEPAVKPAFEKYHQNIMVLATPATLQQKRYGELLKKIGAGDCIINIECGHLAELVEKGNLQTPHIKAYIYDKIKHLRGQQIDGIVIGCTHYSFISDQIKDVVKKMCGGACEVFDGMYGTARHVKEVLQQSSILSDSTHKGTVKFFSSNDDTAVFEKFFKIL